MSTLQANRLTWAVHISVVALVALWLFPTVGLFVSSFRTADQIANSAGGRRCSPGAARRCGDPRRGRGRAGGWRIRHHRQHLFEAMTAKAPIIRWGTSSREPEAYEPATPPIWAMTSA
jgi:alpha-glucoside transport system permease protein